MCVCARARARVCLCVSGHLLALELTLNLSHSFLSLGRLVRCLLRSRSCRRISLSLLRLNPLRLRLQRQPGFHACCRLFVQPRSQRALA